MNIDLANDPCRFISLCWPDMQLYGKQREIIESVRDNIWTFTPAANEVGKSHICAITAWWFFLTRQPCKTVIISTTDKHLKNVLWRSLMHLKNTSAFQLPVTIHSSKVDKWADTIGKDLLAEDYIIGQVTNEPDSFQGHHLPKQDVPRVLLIGDESSGIMDAFFEAAIPWAHRILFVGNPLNTTNFFFFQSRKGDAEDPAGYGGLLRKVIHVSAEDTPNVQAGMYWEQLPKDSRTARPPVIIDGLISYEDYLRRKHEMPEPERIMRLEGQFYTGDQALLFTHAALDASQKRWKTLPPVAQRDAVAMGIDTGQGRDLTVWTIVDDDGVIAFYSDKKSRARTVVNKTVQLVEQYNIDPKNVAIDFGGGGNEIAQFLPWRVRCVMFGESASQHRRVKGRQKKEQQRVTRISYKNRRAEMYGILSSAMNPELREKVFAIPPHHVELRKELSVIPLMWDNEGKLQLPPKDQTSANAKDQLSMRSLLGGKSPDHADSLALAYFALKNAKRLTGFEGGSLNDDKADSFTASIESQTMQFFNG